jgi:hypothetical protein
MSGQAQLRLKLADTASETAGGRLSIIRLGRVRGHSIIRRAREAGEAPRSARSGIAADGYGRQYGAGVHAM